MVSHLEIFLGLVSFFFRLGDTLLLYLTAQDLPQNFGLEVSDLHSRHLFNIRIFYTLLSVLSSKQVAVMDQCRFDSCTGYQGVAHGTVTRS